MYICVCKAITERQLESAINEGLCTRKQLFECFGLGGDCGKCNKDIHQRLHAQAVQELTTACNESAFASS